MRKPFAIFLSTAAAAATPAAIAALYVVSLPWGTPGNVLAVFCMSFMLAFWHVMTLGLPAALILIHKRVFRAWTMLVAGAIVGLIPAGLMFFPYSVQRDWPGYLTLAAGALGLGASGGVAFYVVHRMLSTDNSSRPTSFRSAAQLRRQDT